MTRYFPIYADRPLAWDPNAAHLSAHKDGPLPTYASRADVQALIDQDAVSRCLLGLPPMQATFCQVDVSAGHCLHLLFGDLARYLPSAGQIERYAWRQRNPSTRRMQAVSPDVAQAELARCAWSTQRALSYYRRVDLQCA